MQSYIFAYYLSKGDSLEILLNHISTIIFDLGGVIIDLNVSKSLDSFSKYSGLPSDEIYNKFVKDGWSCAFERGEISDEEFRNRVRDCLGTEINDIQVDNSWNAMLGELPLKRLEMLSNLKDQYHTMVLSNTNSIHINAFDAIVANTTGGRRIQQYFNKIYFSHELGMRKPDVEIYEYVISENNLDPSATLFIDDTEANVEGALSVGFKTYHLTNQEYLYELFD